VEALLLFGGGGAVQAAQAAGDDLLRAWLEFCSNDAVRWLLNGGVGGVYALLAWGLGETPPARALPKQPRKALWAIWAALGAVAAFFVGFFVPGLEAAELVPVAGLGGASTALLARSPAHAHLEALGDRMGPRGHPPT
jgi:hypothetical protein